VDIDLIQRGLASWLRNISGLPAVIENEPRPALDRMRGFWVVSPPHTITPLGTDTVSYTNGVATVIGRRSFVCSVRFICRDQSAKKNARYWLEQARMSLYRPVVAEHLRTYGTGLIRMAPTMSYDAPHDGRMESIAAAELTLTCGVLDTMGAENVGTLESVEVSGELDPDSANYTETIGPV